ncbi:MAG: WG repeat-containing protein [Bacillota bacterium]|nr:WG repeat-containing protein [Bacillota bacterium]
MKKLIIYILLMAIVLFTGCSKDKVVENGIKKGIYDANRNISKNVKIEVALEPCLNYDSIHSFSNGLAKVYDKNKPYLTRYGYINEKGEEIIPTKYCAAKDFNEGYAFVSSDETWWKIVDTNGNEITKQGIIERVDFFKDGLALVEDDTWFYGHYIDVRGNKVITLATPNNRKMRGSSFNNGLACVYSYEADKFGYIDKTGSLVIPFEYDKANPFSEDVAVVKKNEKSYIIDRGGKTVAEIKGLVWEGDRSYDYSSIGGYNNDLGPYYEDTNIICWEFMFSDGLLAANNGTTATNYKPCYLDKKGKEVIKFKEGVSYIYQFNDGRALVSDYHGARAIIDKNGNFITDFKYDSCRCDASFNEGVLFAKLISEDDDMTKYVCIDLNGKELFTGIIGYGGFSEGYAPFRYEYDGPWGILKLVND